MQARLLAALGCLLVAAACSAPKAATTSAATPAATPKPARPAPKPKHVAAQATASSAQRAAPQPLITDKAPIEDLLRVTNASVNVSSTVEDPRNQPEHLVDYEPKTAWQSLSEDRNPWIRVELPAQVQVDRFELTVGFTKSVGNQDAFTQNHRITEVSVRRGGNELGRFLLDPMQRALQTLPVSGGGGSYEIQVTRTLPGTRPEWREIAVSELRVMGRTPDALRHAPVAPAVEVGNLSHAEVMKLNERATSSSDDKAAPSIAALCETYVANAPLTRQNDEGLQQRSATPTCKPEPTRYALPKSSTYLGLSRVKVFDGFTCGTDFVVRTARGYSWLPLSRGYDTPEGPGCGNLARRDELDSIRIEHDYLVLQMHVANASKPKAPRQFQSVFWCQEANSKLTCHGYDPPPLVHEFKRFRITSDGTLHPSDSAYD